ncbi:hypothetical protein CA982_01080 [Gordonia lacunae]|uniref:Uncharacterized protein n=1 Tax=Gordonia lacunae TaxID=417102 RepID=A0A2C9ZL57_9ACTN|nr:hypothetical protein CA982_01080 [Gordonia lacunae]
MAIVLVAAELRMTPFYVWATVLVAPQWALRLLAVISGDADGIVMTRSPSPHHCGMGRDPIGTP